MLHQGHNIAWAKLDEVILVDELRNRFYVEDRKGLDHFCNTFSTALEIFSESTVIDEKYNPFNWSIDVYGCGGYMGSLLSLIYGYINLNLLLLNRKKYEKWANNYDNWVFQVCSGKLDGGHEKWLSDPFNELFENGKLKEFDQEVATKIIERCKVFFRCLYSYNKYKKITSYDIKDCISYEIYDCFE